MTSRPAVLGALAPPPERGRRASGRLCSLASDLGEIVGDPKGLVRTLELCERELDRRMSPLQSALTDLRQRTARLETEGERKDTDIRSKDADLRAKDAALEEARRHVAELADLRLELGNARVELLFLRGRLNMRGVVEYVERHETARLRIPFSASRQRRWEVILARHPGLTACLLATGPGRELPGQSDSERAAALVDDLYRVLSVPHHPAISPANARDRGPRVLNEHAGDIRYADMVDCLCRHYYISFHLVELLGDPTETFYSDGDGLPPLGAPPPAAATDGRRSADATARPTKSPRRGKRRG